MAVAYHQRYAHRYAGAYDLTAVGADCDYQLLKKYILKNKNLPHFELSAYSIEQILGELIGRQVDDTSNVVLCGNSASYSNNHAYVMKYIKPLVNNTLSINMILSYGGNHFYNKRIINRGRKLFGGQFNAICNFMTLNDYNQLLSSAKICIYGNWRQEAVGNIVIALYLGSKVYLSKHNPLLKNLLDLGYIVYALEDATKESFYEKLSQEIKERNREVAIQRNNFADICNKIMQQFS